MEKVDQPTRLKLDRKIKSTLHLPLGHNQLPLPALTIKYTITFFANASASLDITSWEVIAFQTAIPLPSVARIKYIKTEDVSAPSDTTSSNRPAMSAHPIPHTILPHSPASASKDTRSHQIEPVSPRISHNHPSPILQSSPVPSIKNQLGIIASALMDST